MKLKFIPNPVRQKKPTPSADQQATELIDLIGKQSAKKLAISNMCNYFLSAKKSIEWARIYLAIKAK